jgi:hypothetical protein
MKTRKRGLRNGWYAGAMEAIAGMTEKLDKIDIPKATNSMNCIW